MRKKKGKGKRNLEVTLIEGFNFFDDLDGMKVVRVIFSIGKVSVEFPEKPNEKRKNHYWNKAMTIKFPYQRGNRVDLVCKVYRAGISKEKEIGSVTIPNLHKTNVKNQLWKFLNVKMNKSGGVISFSIFSQDFGIDSPDEKRESNQQKNKEDSEPKKKKKNKSILGLGFLTRKAKQLTITFRRGIGFRGIDEMSKVHFKPFQKKLSEKDLRKGSKEVVQDTVESVYSSKCRIPFQDLELQESLTGKANRIFKGLYKEEDIIFKMYDILGSDKKKFFRSFRAYVRLSQYPTIVKFLGVVATDIEEFDENSDDEKEQLGVVSEFCDFGDLKSFLHLNYQYLDDFKRLQLLFDIVQGVKFLHKNNIIHRNLHMENVLLKSITSSSSTEKFEQNNESTGEETITVNYQPLFVCKIANFEKAVMDPNLKLGGQTIMVGDDLQYSAPETMSGAYTEKSDVYSFGVIGKHIMQMTSPPKPENQNEYNAGISGSIDLSWVSTLLDHCTDNSPTQRPSIDKVYELFLKNSLALSLIPQPKKRSKTKKKKILKLILKMCVNEEDLFSTEEEEETSSKPPNLNSNSNFSEFEHSISDCSSSENSLEYPPEKSLSKKTSTPAAKKKFSRKGKGKGMSASKKESLMKIMREVDSNKNNSTHPKILCVFAKLRGGKDEEVAFHLLEERNELTLRGLKCVMVEKLVLPSLVCSSRGIVEEEFFMECVMGDVDIYWKMDKMEMEEGGGVFVNEGEVGMRKLLVDEDVRSLEDSSVLVIEYTGDGKYKRKSKGKAGNKKKKEEKGIVIYVRLEDEEEDEAEDFFLERRDWGCLGTVIDKYVGSSRAGRGYGVKCQSAQDDVVRELKGLDDENVKELVHANDMIIVCPKKEKVKEKEKEKVKEVKKKEEEKKKVIRHDGLERFLNEMQERRIAELTSDTKRYKDEIDGLRKEVEKYRTRYDQLQKESREDIDRYRDDIKILMEQLDKYRENEKK